MAKWLQAERRGAAYDTGEKHAPVHH
jgi:hypothetical protein